MTLSIIIPTKNRPEELFLLIKSIINQIKLPNQVIIVDQSSKENIKSKRIINLVKNNKVLIEYIKNDKISGLVEAKAFL